MEKHSIVSEEQWLTARKQLLAKEKELTHLRDQLSDMRRALPWTRVDSEYSFEGPEGKVTLAQLFEGKSQLVVYHLMFQPENQAPCRSCAFWADAFDGMRAHLAQRDVRLIAISRAPRAKLEPFAKRMGWTFPWYSAVGNQFNVAYGVTFPNLTSDRGKAYNFGTQVPPGSEMPGVSVFVRDADGTVFHTYSCYGRGIDALNPAYQYLDLVPKGRDEAGLSHAMAWVRHHDEY
jgi:predicted dithiol-disulfide oxidoreductase (DUF899 family)